ncbi:deoxyribonuclease IV [bacterium]|nr:MAG: deoxyribonuclease IV [bacterium]
MVKLSVRTDAKSAGAKVAAKAAAKTVGKNLPLIGCHVSIAGGLQNAPARAAELGCETFQIFSRSPRGGTAPAITTDMEKEFAAEMEKYGFKNFVIHAPYILNFGSKNPRSYNGSISLVRTDLERGSQLGASYVMFHPGSFKDLGPKLGMKQAQDGLKKVLDGYKGTTKLLIEISAGAGEVIGDTFEEIAELMAPIAKNKAFGGVCFDTQHAFGSGYDISNAKGVEDTFKKFDKIIGLKYLAMCHVNDSKVELGARKDRHEHIDEGYIGKAGFKAILDFFKKKKMAIPLILETEHDKVEKDIKLLKDLRGK